MRISTNTGRSCRNAVKVFCGKIKSAPITEQIIQYVGCTGALYSCQLSALMSLKQTTIVQSKRATSVLREVNIEHVIVHWGTGTDELPLLKMH